MRVVSIVFGVLNDCACVLCLLAYWMEHRKVKKRGVGHSTAKEAYEYVAHWLMLLWWIAGTIFIAILRLNPFWIFAWILVGMIVYMFVDGLAEVGGLTTLLQMGEMSLRAMAEEGAAELDRIVHREE